MFLVAHQKDADILITAQDIIKEGLAVPQVALRAGHIVEDHTDTAEVQGGPKQVKG